MIKDQAKSNVDFDLGILVYALGTTLARLIFKHYLIELSTWLFGNLMVDVQLQEKEGNELVKKQAR